MAENGKSIKSDLARVEALSDDEIDYSDIPELDDSFWERATVLYPPSKKQITVRLDEDVLLWLKSKGRGYQTRMNAMLRAMMESDQARSPR